jgi:agmatinase
VFAWQQIERSLKHPRYIGCDVVEVAPAYDHGGITGLADARTASELISLIALSENR